MLFTKVSRYVGGLPEMPWHERRRFAHECYHMQVSQIIQMRRQNKQQERGGKVQETGNYWIDPP